MAQGKENRILLVLVALGGILGLLVCVSAIFFLSILPPFDPLHWAYIDANEPAAGDFQRFMKRDLESYFTGVKGRPITIEYELLRQGATQVGVADPKYYVWVKLLDRGQVVEEGAVRVAASERTRFEVTHYLSKESIKSNAQAIYQIFPGPVCEKIKEKLK